MIYQSYDKTSNIWNIPNGEDEKLFERFDMRYVQADSSQIAIQSTKTPETLGVLKVVHLGSFDVPSNYQLGGIVGPNLSGTLSDTVVYLSQKSSPTVFAKLESFTGLNFTSREFPAAFAEGLKPNFDHGFQHLFGGNDTFLAAKGSAKPDGIRGYAGNDTFTGFGDDDPGSNMEQFKGSDFFDGGEGIDAAVYQGRFSDYRIIKNPKVWDRMSEAAPNFLSGHRVFDSIKNRDGTDDLVNVERLRFADKNVALDFTSGQNGYKAAMFIGAAFGASSLGEFFAPALALIDQGNSTEQLSSLVVNLGLIDSRIGATNKAFVAHVYTNVVGFAPDPLSQAVYENSLNQGVYTKAGLLTLAATAAPLENRINLLGLQDHGLEYTPFL